tara:strand:- start:13993 stop:14466 length:474 start_codon:yes stop_codon:yes gene_type:complete
MKHRPISVSEDLYLIINATADRLCVPINALSFVLASIIVGSLDRDLGRTGLNVGMANNPKKRRKKSAADTVKTVAVEEGVAVRLYNWAQALNVSSTDLFGSCSTMTLHQMRNGKTRGFVTRRDGFQTSAWPHDLQGFVDRLRASVTRAVEEGKLDNE